MGTDYRTLAKVYDNVTPEDQLAAFEAAKEKATNTMSERQERRNRNPARHCMIPTISRQNHVTHSDGTGSLPTRNLKGMAA